MVSHAPEGALGNFKNLNNCHSNIDNNIDNMNMLLNNPLGMFLYHFLRNDWSWRLLGNEGRQKVNAANFDQNTTREDYNPEKYGGVRTLGGENWDNFHTTDMSQRIDRLLESNPRRVLEIGHGAGFYTRQICEYPSVKEYTGIDINRQFFSYLATKLQSIKDIKYNLICGDVLSAEIDDGKYDLIVLFSTVHHIPDRVGLFLKLKRALSENGVIFCTDPSHYIPRFVNLARKCLFKGYLGKKFYQKLTNLSTHNMCSVGEYKSVFSKSGLQIDHIEYIQHPKFPRVGRWFSKEIYVTVKNWGQGSFRNWGFCKWCEAIYALGLSVILTCLCLLPIVWLIMIICRSIKCLR